MTYEESEEMSFQLSCVESLVKGFVSRGNLEKSMNSLKGDMKTLEEMIEKQMENTVGTVSTSKCHWHFEGCIQKAKSLQSFDTG